MTTQPRPDGRHMHDTATRSGDDGDSRDGAALSPAIGPVPAIYIPQSPCEAGTSGLIWHAALGTARRTGGWVGRRLPGRHRRTSTEGTMSEIPDSLRYTEDHFWARADSDTGLVRVGVTDFAQQSLGDVVDVTLPRPGETVKAGNACGDIESTKSINDLVAPVDGTVRTRNDNLAGSPELVNTDPYGHGWMFEVEADPSTLDRQLAGLMDAHAYRGLAGA